MPVIKEAAWTSGKLIVGVCQPGAKRLACTDPHSSDCVVSPGVVPSAVLTLTSDADSTID